MSQRSSVVRGIGAVVLLVTVVSIAPGADRPEPIRLSSETIVPAARAAGSTSSTAAAAAPAAADADSGSSQRASKEGTPTAPIQAAPKGADKPAPRERISVAARPRASSAGPRSGAPQPVAIPAEAAQKLKTPAADEAASIPTPDVDDGDGVTPDDSDSSAVGSAATDKPRSPLTSEQAQLRDRLRTALAVYYPKHLNGRDHSPWEMMHGIIAYGTDALVFRSGESGQTVNAVGWMCYNYPCRGEQLLYLDQGQRLVARKGPGLQGHYGQFLAILAQSHVSADYPMRVGGKEFTIRDLIEHEQRDCQSGEELTFKLIGLMHYLPSDATWKARDGQTWSMPRLLNEEIRQPINGAACGGTHRLMGISYAVGKRRQRNEPVDGEYARAQKYLHDYHLYTLSLQNPDGSFSTEWFKRKGANPDLDRRLKTTGHTVEWLAYSLPEEQLLHPQMVKAVEYLTSILLNHRAHSWEVGPRGHALHALRLYDRRVFKPHDQPQRSVPEVARRDRAKVGDDALVDAEANSPPTPPAGTEPPTEAPAQREPRTPTPWDDEPDEGTPHLEPDTETTTAAAEATDAGAK